MSPCYCKQQESQCSFPRETDFFVVGAGILQGDILTSYLFIICLDYILRTSIDLKKKEKKTENGFTRKKTRSRRYPAETITDVDYADDIVLHAITPTQAEFQLHNLEQAVGGIGFHRKHGQNSGQEF